MKPDVAAAGTTATTSVSDRTSPDNPTHYGLAVTVLPRAPAKETRWLALALPRGILPTLVRRYAERSINDQIRTLMNESLIQLFAGAAKLLVPIQKFVNEPFHVTNRFFDGAEPRNLTILV